MVGFLLAVEVQEREPCERLSIASSAEVSARHKALAGAGRQ